MSSQKFLPPPPPHVLDHLQGEVERLRDGNEQASLDMRSMLINAAEIRGEIRNINTLINEGISKQLLGLWALVVSAWIAFSSALWIGYVRLDDKIESKNVAILENLDSKISGINSSMEGSIEEIKGIVSQGLPDHQLTSGRADNKAELKR